MSILVYHGAPGSYKTSSAVQEQLIPAIKTGRKVIDDENSADGDIRYKQIPRPIVTNVRGLTSDSIRDFFKDLPSDWLDGCEVINVDSSTAEGREKWLRWFHWVPLGAFLIVDEAQNVWPSRLKEVDYQRLYFPATDLHPDYQDAAKAAGRPADFITAFDMHRHYNWDIVLTTPNIKKIHSEIRLAAEGAYKHKNLAVLGSLFKGRYTQMYHDANDNGNASDAITIETKSIKKSTFTLYQSTATGNFSDTKAGTSIFKDPKILILLCLVFAPFGYIAWAGAPSLFRESNSQPSHAPAVASSPAAVSGRQASGQVPFQMGAVPPADLPPGQGPAFRHPLDGMSLTIVGSISTPSRSLTVYSVSDSSGSSYQLSDGDLVKLGYHINRINDCASQVVFFPTNVSFIAGCSSGSARAAAPAPVLQIPQVTATPKLAPDLPPDLLPQVQKDKAA